MYGLPQYVCENCGFVASLDKRLYICPVCGDPLTIMFDDKEMSFIPSGKGVWRYSSMLPITGKGAISLNEGGTQLHQSVRLYREIGVGSLMFKNEGLNPTASFKDRGMTVAVTKAFQEGAHGVICASTGNTAASLAAYAARAGIAGYVVVPEGAVATGKLMQARAYGAEIIHIKGNFDDALKAVSSLAMESNELYLVNSINPYRIEGQKTMAFEIYEDVGIPDWISIPVGNAGNITALWKGFKELYRIGVAKKLPRLIGVQAEGAAPIYRAFINGASSIEPVNNPSTVATAIRIGKPASWRRALKAIRESHGIMVAVSDEEIMSAYYSLSSKEGVFVEPASAASFAGLRKLSTQGLFKGNEMVVAILTGHGLKDPESAAKVPKKELTVEPTKEAIAGAILSPARVFR